MFSCEICGDGLREYELTMRDDGTLEICASCYDRVRVPERHYIKSARRFVGLAPSPAGEWHYGERYNSAGEWNPRLVACFICEEYREPDALDARDRCKNCEEK